MERFTLNAQDADAVIQRIGKIGNSQPQSPGIRNHCILAYTPGGGIAARSGTTVSSANCTVYYNDNGTLTSASFTVPIYNLSTTAVAGSSYVLAVLAGGTLFCNWEDC